VRAASCRLCGSPALERRFPLRRATGHDVLGCRGCGVEFLDPQPTPEVLERVYREEYYEAWAVRGREDEARTHLMKKATFRAWLAELPVANGRLLDLGCAMGSLLEVARERGFEPHGVELSSYAAKLAAERIGPGRIHNARLEDAPLAKGSFDAITMCDYLEHVEEPGLVLDRVRELLAPSGAVLVVCPDNGALWRRLFGRHWIEYKLEHLYYFTRRSLERLARAHGFRVAKFVAGKKTMRLRYLVEQARAFRPPVVGPVLGAVGALAPAALQDAEFRIYLGNFLAVLRTR
jgi:2-polyprenyl-3-methyl-5-hydroxy-6-metoxy-1,4-benzoquinol methylase